MSKSNNNHIAKDAERVLATGTVMRTDESALFVPNRGRAMPLYSYTKDNPFAKYVASLCGRSPNSKGTTAVIRYLEALAFRGSAFVRGVNVLDATVTTGDGLHHLVHLGHGHVVELLPGGARARVANGCYGMVFLDPPEFAPVNLTDSHLAWTGGEDSYLMRAIIDGLPPPAGDLTVREQGALMIALWFTPFITSMARGKPVYLLVGAPGIGKSVTQKLYAAALYGSAGDTTGSLGGSRAGKDFFAQAAHLPLVVRDDVNRLDADTMNSICQASTGMTLHTSEFFQTLGLARYRIDACFFFSAFMPAWLGRRDLMSRLITLDIKRPPRDSVTERERIAAVMRVRDWIWAETLLVIATALSRSKPAVSPVRFDDWYSVIHRVLGCYGMAEDFDRALSKMSTESVRIACASDPELARILAVAHDGRWGRDWWRIADLMDALSEADGVMSHAHDPHRAANFVRDPQKVAGLLRRMMTSYSGVVTVVARPGRGHQNVYRMWPSDQPDPLAMMNSEADDEQV